MSSNSDDTKARIAASYNAIAPAYNDYTTSHNKLRLHYLSQVLEILKIESNPNEEANVLELGCGAGIPVTKILLENTQPKLHVIGNDISSGQLDIARGHLSEYANTSRLELLESDMLSLSYPAGSLSAVLGFYSIIHLPRTEQTKLVQNIASWLKPGGILLANFGDQEIGDAVNEKWLGEEKGWMYWSSWGADGSVKMVEDAGFEILVREASDEEGDAKFVWVLARKK